MQLLARTLRMQNNTAYVAMHIATTMAHGRPAPFRSRLAHTRRTRIQPSRAAHGAEAADERRERAAAVRARRRARRLLLLGAAAFPTRRDGSDAPAPAQHTDDALEDVLVQSASDASAPLPTDRAARMSPAVRRLLTTRRGANALFADAVHAHQLHAFPDFMLGPPTYPARPLCSICHFWAAASCMRCGEQYCSRSCADVCVSY